MAPPRPRLRGQQTRRSDRQAKMRGGIDHEAGEYFSRASVAIIKKPGSSLGFRLGGEVEGRCSALGFEDGNHRPLLIKAITRGENLHGTEHFFSWWLPQWKSWAINPALPGCMANQKSTPPASNFACLFRLYRYAAMFAANFQARRRNL